MIGYVFAGVAEFWEWGPLDAGMSGILTTTCTGSSGAAQIWLIPG